MALAFISAFLLAFFVCSFLGVALPHRPGAELQVSSLFLQFMCAPLHVLVVLLCVVVGTSLVFWSVLVFFFSLPPLPLFTTMHHYGCLLFYLFIFFH